MTGKNVIIVKENISDQMTGNKKMKYETDKGVIARCHVNTSGAFGMLHWRTKCLLYFKLKEKK